MAQKSEHMLRREAPLFGKPRPTKLCPECGGEGICYRTQALDDCTGCNGTGRVPAPPQQSPAATSERKEGGNQP